MTLRVLDLFSGIGGFSLGLERTGGFRTVAFCDIDPYCRAVLKKHWTAVPIFEDVRDLHAIDVGPVDVICGGFPCQDISLAGKGAGLAGARSGLWSEYRRLIEECRPRYAIIENVSALRSRGLEALLGQLAEIGYDAEWHCISASAVGAPHRRDRVWIVAYPGGEGRRQELRGAHGDEGQDAGRPSQDLHVSGGHGTKRDVAHPQELGSRARLREVEAQQHRDQLADGRCDVADAYCQPFGRLAIAWGECDQWLVEPDVGRVANGVPSRVDRLRALGNAVVPQIPEIIGRAILAAERE